MIPFLFIDKVISELLLGSEGDKNQHRVTEQAFPHVHTQRHVGAGATHVVILSDMMSMKPKGYTDGLQFVTLCNNIQPHLTNNSVLIQNATSATKTGSTLIIQASMCPLISNC